jgi:site-specific recombinase XerD
MAPDLDVMLDSWLLHLRAERKSKQTLKTYGDGVRRYLAWCDRNDTPAVLERTTVNAFVSDLLDAGAEASTARSRQLALKRLSAWCVEEGEVDVDQLAGLKPPKLDQKVLEPLTREELLALLKACDGKAFFDRRDEAIVRLMAETTARAGEVVAMEVPQDVDLTRSLATVRRGKGGKGRIVAFSPQTARALDRYLRLRRGHRLAGTSALWLGDRGKGLGYYGLYSALTARADTAGITRFHPHLLRHTAATRWLEAGGSEGGLMAMAGWTRRDMVDRYTRATASSRAVEEAHRLGLGDL